MKPGPKPRSLYERFWGKVNKTDGCWIWTGGVNPRGYGKLKVNGRWVLAHRLSWELKVGPIPDGLFACHQCDNPPCVRPSHLFLGTARDNNADMFRKGRQNYERGPGVSRWGEANFTARITNDQADEIRELYAAGGVSQERLAVAYGIDQTSVSQIILNRRYRSERPDAA